MGQNSVLLYHTTRVKGVHGPAGMAERGYFLRNQKEDL